MLIKTNFSTKLNYSVNTQEDAVSTDFYRDFKASTILRQSRKQLSVCLAIIYHIKLQTIPTLFLKQLY
jgi:hypothetical protein